MEIPVDFLVQSSMVLVLCFVSWFLLDWARRHVRGVVDNSWAMDRRHRRASEEMREFMREEISRVIASVDKVNDPPPLSLVRTSMSGEMMTVTPACKVCADCLAEGIAPGPCECEGR